MPRPLPFTAVAWTLAALVIAATPHLMAMPAWLALIFGTAVAWRLAAARFNWAPPPAALRLLLTFVLLVLVVIAVGGNWSRRGATTLLCLMMAAKLMEMFSARDLRMVASICFFMMAAQFLFNERLAYLIYLAAGSFSATAALARIQQIDAVTIRPSGATASEFVEVTRSAAWMLVLALPVAIALFVLFPRLAQPLWGLPEQAIDGRTGLSDEMTAGSITNLFLDDSPAFRVEFSETPPPVEQRYWRGPVLSVLDGSTWRRPGSIDANTRPAAGEVDGQWQYRVQMEPHERRWLFALDYPQAGPEGSSLTRNQELLARSPITTLTQYDATSSLLNLDREFLSPMNRRLHLDLDEGRNPRTRALAEQFRASHPDDVDLVQAVLEWLNEEPFHYSLRTLPLGRHFADEFLLDIRTGYCEYYASAFAVLMRAAGIPSRVVVGYQGGFWQEAAGYLLVRQSDAHAWNEVWLVGVGWIRVDPTAAVAPDRVEQGARGAIREPRHALDFQWLRELQNRYDRVQHLWNRWILGFDASRQQRMLERLGLPDAGSGTLAALMVLAMALTIALVSAVLYLRGRRPALSAAEQSWNRLLGRLRRRGLNKQISETPLEFSHRVADQLSNHEPDLVQLAIMFNHVHYGIEQPAAADRFIRQADQFRPTIIRRRAEQSND